MAHHVKVVGSPLTSTVDALARSNALPLSQWCLECN